MFKELNKGWVKLRPQRYRENFDCLGLSIIYTPLFFLQKCIEVFERNTNKVLTSKFIFLPESTVHLIWKQRWFPFYFPCL